jgi:hypothetical protein
MNRPVVFRPQAERELLDAERWYEDRKPGLGIEFRAALDEVLARVRALPLNFPKAHGDKRRALVPRFPYGLYFALWILFLHSDLEYEWPAPFPSVTLMSRLLGWLSRQPIRNHGDIDMWPFIRRSDYEEASSSPRLLGRAV